jgi:hypothetical protein
MAVSHKVCTRCKLDLPLDQFYPDKTHKDGLNSRCKSCSNIISKSYRDKNPTKMASYKINVRNADPIKHLLFGAKTRSNKYNIPFNITPKNIDRPTHCPILGIELNYSFSGLGKGITGNNSATLDRTFPELGYVKGNVVVISWRANRLKNDITKEEMKAFAKFYSVITSSL